MGYEYFTGYSYLYIYMYMCVYVYGLCIVNNLLFGYVWTWGIPPNSNFLGKMIILWILGYTIFRQTHLLARNVGIVTSKNTRSLPGERQILAATMLFGAALWWQSLVIKHGNEFDDFPGWLGHSFEKQSQSKHSFVIAIFVREHWGKLGLVDPTVLYPHTLHYLHTSDFN